MCVYSAVFIRHVRHMGLYQNGEKKKKRKWRKEKSDI